MPRVVSWCLPYRASIIPDLKPLGDVIVQRHQLGLSADAPSGDYALYTGAYWLDTLERWPVLVKGEPVGDQVALSPLPVAYAVSR